MHVTLVKLTLSVKFNVVNALVEQLNVFNAVAPEIFREVSNGFELQVKEVKAVNPDASILGKTAFELILTLVKTGQLFIWNEVSKSLLSIFMLESAGQLDKFKFVNVVPTYDDPEYDVNDVIAVFDKFKVAIGL